MEKFSVLRLMEQVPDEAAAYEFMERLRWHGTPECPHCGSTERCYFLTPVNGKSRETSTGAASQRRLWKCAACRKKFSVLTGTVMHGTKIPVRVWVMVMFEMCCNKNGVSAREVERRYGMTPKSAWFLLHRIREVMKRNGLEGMFSGTVVADETFIGGKVKNRHQQGRPIRKPYGAGSKSGPAYNKTAVLTLIEKGTCEARSKVVRDVTGATLLKHIAEQVNMPATTLHTDSASAYKSIAHEFIAHESVDHSSYEFVRGDVSTNQAEGYFSQLKRSLDGTHHRVSVEHLPRYLAEFDYRYTTRKVSDTERMLRLADQMGGRRLAYRPLIDKTS